ncbi:MAG TPA: tail fiber domain-containing protein [Enterobacter asburiae]|nr:tail fiber domain-containing protein [Enterobacter asburiae]MBE4859044.1 tail fiber domain-containing protein [Enterobacter cloacae complex sp. S3]MBA7766904.1 tail fiber domain-containing protein [Enterobacter asburiae]MBF1983671.1 tail fiber domain-containing protein [Enterobacter asburiae]MBG0649629.1 tail fiber domain-containing protein [Enterobacter asburiae]
MSDAELSTARSLTNMIKAFRFTDSVDTKSDGARIHFGVIAQ